MHPKDSMSGKKSFICGIDEVGRGPLAGPVLAGAVIWPARHSIVGLKDSKKLSATTRRELSAIIKMEAMATGSGWIWPDEIDRINIHHASLRAMQLALDEALGQLLKRMKAAEVFPFLSIRVDGKFLPNLQQSVFREALEDVDILAVIRGDDSIPAISAASIVAKVTRDRWMEEYHQTEPVYGFDRHKGYPTAAHRRAIHIHGPSAIQRLTFRS